MKKIRLNVANLETTEILSKEQLRSIFGGSEGSGTNHHLCDGKPSNIKCIDINNYVVYTIDSIGCPSTNMCGGNYTQSCTC